MNDTKRNDGGPAFPQHDLSEYGIGPSMVDGSEIYDVRGMSLRDYFAGQIVEQCIRNSLANDGSWDPHNVAYHAYAVADAMLAARNASR